MANVLVIEDNKSLREILNEILELRGFIVETAVDGYQAIQKTQIRKPDIIICDVNMPTMNGWETLKHFKSIPEFQFIPFIFLTAKTTLFDMRKGMNLGANDYLTKPFDHVDLFNSIDRQLINYQTQIDAFNLKTEEQINDVKNNLLKNFKEITADLEDSLKSASHVQSFILPTKSQMDKMFKEHFNFFLPKNALSGDFYWVKALDGIKYVAVADCTGHGIPAAMISMVYHQILNSTIDIYHLSRPKEILEKANTLVNAFMRAQTDQVVHYGMDISIVAIDEENQLLTFAGAGSSLTYTTTTQNTQLEALNIDPSEINNAYSLYKIRGNSNGIGNMDPSFIITEQCFNYAKNDRIYLYSDGYSDQFGGDLQKKFKTTNFLKLILSIQKEPISDQVKIIENTFSLWKGDLPSVDDVTVLGIRL